MEGGRRRQQPSTCGEVLGGSPSPGASPNLSSATARAHLVRRSAKFSPVSARSHVISTHSLRLRRVAVPPPPPPFGSVSAETPAPSGKRSEATPGRSSSGQGEAAAQLNSDVTRFASRGVWPPRAQLSGPRKLRPPSSRSPLSLLRERGRLSIVSPPLNCPVSFLPGSPRGRGGGASLQTPPLLFACSVLPCSLFLQLLPPPPPLLFLDSCGSFRFSRTIPPPHFRDSPARPKERKVKTFPTTSSPSLPPPRPSLPCQRQRACARPRLSAPLAGGKRGMNSPPQGCFCFETPPPGFHLLHAQAPPISSRGRQRPEPMN